MSEQCDCVQCRAKRAGIGPAPWTPDQWARIQQDVVVDPGPVKSDPAVIAAELRRDEARAAFDVVDETWLEVMQAQASLDMRGHLGGNRAYVSDGNGMGHAKTPADLAAEARLREQVEEATEARAKAWERVCKANEAIQRAQFVAQQRVELAEARGK